MAMAMAAPLVDAVVGKVANDAVDSVWRQIGYIWNYKTNIDDLRKQLLKLKAERESMLHIMDEATKNLDQIEDTATLWLKNADDAIEAAEELLKGNDTSEGCFICCTPNLKARHQFSRKAKKETPVVTQVHQDRGSIYRISRPLDVQTLEFVKNYEALDSRMEALKYIVGALKNDDVNVIGVYGLGGVGKTTLVKQQVVSQVKEEGTFKVVAVADVTLNLDLSKIQQEIAYWLQLKLDIESIEIRAAKLHARLMKEKNVLIVLDDIWEKIELGKIGIPNLDDHKGLKILMTSRDLNILMRMNVQRHFLLQVLPEEEAWHLFQQKAGDLKSSELQRIAAQVAWRCAGLPILIVAVATSLRGQESYEWSDALEHLQKFDDKGMDEKVYSALELSYKFLGDDHKSLLVLCSQLSASDILMSDLVKYAKGLDLFHNCTTIRVLRNRLLKVVNDLKRSCLLHQRVGENDTVKMHDVIHSFATKIAAKQHHVFTVASNTELEEWPKNETFELCTAISFPYCKIPDLAHVLECPKLESFILGNDDPSLEIPDMFFSKMKKLKLLDLSDVNLLKFPSSLCFPENLQTLCLERCVLEDISAIGKLNQLQVLSLVGSNIVQLPMEIKKLTRLQILDVSKCRRLEVILPGILICFTKLEELLMLGSSVRWEGEGHTEKRNNASLSELKTLSNLINLEIHFTDAKILPVDLLRGKFERFKILIGDGWDSYDGDYASSKVVKLNHKVGFELERVRILLTETEDLHLDDLKGVENVIPKLERQGFPTLKHLHIQNCHEMQVIVDRTRMGNIIFFSSLESLSLLNLNKLENIYFGPCASISFNSLNKLKVGNCNALKNLFSLTIFRCLVQLKEIHVTHCEILKEIVAAGRYEDETIKMTQLCSLALEDLPHLEGFCSPTTNEASADLSLVDEFRNLFGKEIEFTNLVELKLSSINVEKIWHNTSIELCPFNKLTTFIVQGCRNLAFVLTSSVVRSLAQLKKFKIQDCRSMEEVIKSEGEIEEEMIFPKLNQLNLEGLPKLVRFCRGNLVRCPSMKVLWIENCPRLRTFVSNGNEVGQQQDPNTLFDEKVDFPNLDALGICGVCELKVIWGNKLHEDSFYKLKGFKVTDAKGLVRVFPQNLEMERFWNLEVLHVYDCDALPEVFDIQALGDLKKERDGIQATQLQTLNINNCANLKHLWNKDPKGILDFQNLSKVHIQGKMCLKNVFPASIAKGLVHLQTFNVLDLEIKEIVAEDEDLILGPTVFEFPQLKRLHLRRLPQLETFYPGTHISEWPSLRSLCITSCNKFHLPIMLQKTVFPKLEVLALNGKEVEMIREGQLPADLFHSLKDLELNYHNQESAVFPYDLLHMFHNLETLQVASSLFEELFPSEGAFIGDEKHPLIPTRLNSLKLYYLTRLSTIWNQALQTLQTLQIMGCDRLITLSPSSASFQSLTSLNIHSCNSLVSLLAHSTAKSLIQLQKLEVRKCDLMKVIISDKGHEITDEINFINLETLVLDCLPSLTSFCNGNHDFRFPRLTTVVVNQCPKIELFSEGVSSTPLLHMVQNTEVERRGDWLGNLNSTIIFLYKKMVGLYWVQHLKVSEFSILRDRWHSQLPVELFCDLESLIVDEIAFSSYAIPSNLLEQLNSLKKLNVSNCEVLEEIFDVQVLSAEHGQIDFLPKLNEFHLISLPRLRNIWNEHAQGVLNFKHLISLKVHNCSSLKMMFTPSMTQGLVQLKEMEVKYCNSIEEIITRGEANKVIDEIVFPLLQSIILESLPCLKSFNSGSKILKCPALEELAIADCPTAFTCTFLGELQSDPAELKVVFPNLKDLSLSLVKIQKIHCNMHQLGISSFSENLTTLNIDGCGNLKYLFSPSMVKGLIHLETLYICNCKLMQEIIHMEKSEKMGEIVFQKLQFLKLQNLQQITQFCTGTLIECVSLTSLWIKNCPELRAFIFDSSVSNNLISTANLFDEKIDFPNLEELMISGVHQVMVIWGNELREDSFCKLTVLSVEDAKQVVKIFPSRFEFTNLEVLKIIGCNALTEVFDIRSLIDVKIERDGVAVSQLKTLEICKTPKLKHVWNEDPEGIVEFCNLINVDIGECQSLESVFPASVARGLVHLEKFYVVDSAVKEIIARDEERMKGASVFEFPQLKELVLRRLPELETFYPLTQIKGPALYQLYITQCYRFQHPTLPFKQILSNMEGLALNGKEVRMIREGQLQVELFQRLKVVEFNFFNDKYAVFPYDLLHIFFNLETLTVAHGKMKELFRAQGVLVGDEKHPLIPTKMNSFRLYRLPNLKTISNQVLQTLETLFIRECDSLILLAPSSASFQSLTSLNIHDCKGLVSLVIFSTATSLTQLKNLSVRNCKQVKVIVSDEGDEIMSEINFRKLGTLVLDCLPNLTSFCSENHSFKFPCLEKVVVKQCPKMEFFSKGVSVTPMLKSVQLKKYQNGGDWLGNLNVTISFLHRKMVGFRELQHLKVSEFSNLKDRWQNELPVEIFCDLNSLVIDEVLFSLYAIPSNLLEYLNKLDKLEVSNCELLERVFDVQGLSDEAQGIKLLSKLNTFHLINLPRLRQVWNEHPRQIFNFGNLKSLKVHNCCSLRMIFTPSITRGLVQLQEMEVKNCVLVEEIISKEAEEYDIISFPQLNSLVLDSLPELKVFRLGRGIVQCPSIEKIIVVDCPNIELFASPADEEQEQMKFDGNIIFLGEVKCQSVMELRVDWSNNVKKILDGELAASHKFFCSLKVLELKHFPIEYTTFPSRFLKRSLSLEELVVSDASFEELFSQEVAFNEEDSLTDVTHLKRLTLSKLPQLRRLIKDQNNSGSSIQHLEALEVLECTKLTILVPSFISFQNLVTLKVSKCDGLLSLTTCSAARSLSQLTRLEITECEMMEEIVVSSEDEVEADISLSQLKHLELHCLPKLTRFCSGNESFNFQSLEEVIVRECPNLETFVQGELSTPNLEGVQTTEDENEWCWDGSLNVTIQKLFKKTIAEKEG